MLKKIFNRVLNIPVFMLAVSCVNFGFYGYHKVKDGEVAPLRADAYQSCVVDKKPCTKDQYNLAAAHMEDVSAGRLQNGFLYLFIFFLAGREEKYKKELKNLREDLPSLKEENEELKALMPELEPYIEVDRKQKADIAAQEEREAVRKATVVQYDTPVKPSPFFKPKK